MFFFCCCDFWCTRLLLELKGETTLCLRAFHFSVFFVVHYAFVISGSCLVCQFPGIISVCNESLSEYFWIQSFHIISSHFRYRFPSNDLGNSLSPTKTLILVGWSLLVASQTKAGEINKSLSQLALVIQRLTSTGSTDDPVMKMNLVDSFCVFWSFWDVLANK